ncbi:interferon-induced protein 44-like [Haliotis rubra]|uniref:interferon-induced protein 44-like n=1 Tax=Haliotis rubra TaxID=36100 RepID=UPI001EE61176|nr:interferon-induced protein 44-like [Haliotis rubra]
MAMSFNPLCREMLKEWLGESHKFKILFDSSQYYNQIEEFHKRCDKSEPTVTIFYTNGDSVFGGYTRQTWQPSSNQEYKHDKRAFLFQLFKRATFNPKKYPVEAHRCAIYCHSDYGPTFGGGQADGTKDIVTQTDTGHKAGVTVRTAIGQAYSPEVRQSVNFTDGQEEVVKFEVFLVIDDNEYVEKAWRNVTQVAVESLRRDLEGFKPPGGLKFTNILLVGQIGAGKSSYLNSITSAFKGYVTSSVPTGSALHSLTQKNEEHRIYTWPQKKPLKLRLWDTRGFEQGMDQHMVPDIQHIIRGRPPSYIVSHPDTGLGGTNCNALFGLPRSHVFPVKNYEQESELDDDVDRLTLLSLRQMLRFTDDFLVQQLQ